MNNVTIYCDGASKGNPGPGGWGVILTAPGIPNKELFGGEAHTTNNRMELLAAIKGLEALRRDGSNVELHTDSQYVVKGCSEWLDGWKRNGWRTSTRKPVVNQDLWQIMDALLNKHNVTLRWVKGHAGHPMNERADVLANMGVSTL